MYNWKQHTNTQSSMEATCTVNAGTAKQHVQTTALPTTHMYNVHTNSTHQYDYTLSPYSTCT